MHFARGQNTTRDCAAKIRESDLPNLNPLILPTWCCQVQNMYAECIWAGNSQIYMAICNRLDNTIQETNSLSRWLHICPERLQKKILCFSKWKPFHAKFCFCQDQEGEVPYQDRDLQVAGWQWWPSWGLLWQSIWHPPSHQHPQICHQTGPLRRIQSWARRTHPSLPAVKTNQVLGFSRNKAALQPK